MASIFRQEVRLTLDSEDTTTDIVEGEPVVRENGGGMHRLDPATDSGFHGILAHHRSGDRIAEHDEDYVAYADFYKVLSGATSVPFQPLVDKDVIQGWTVEDESATEPTFSKNDEVGYIDLGNGPRLVQAGYSTGGTQYGNGGSGDYVKAGYVDAEPAQFSGDNYQRRLSVRLDDANIL